MEGTYGVVSEINANHPIYRQTICLMVTNTHSYAYRIFLCIALYTRSSVADLFCHFYADPDPACHFDPIRILPFIAADPDRT